MYNFSQRTTKHLKHLRKIFYLDEADWENLEGVYTNVHDRKILTTNEV